MIKPIVESGLLWLSILEFSGYQLALELRLIDFNFEADLSMILKSIWSSVHNSDTFWHLNRYVNFFLFFLFCFNPDVRKAGQ